MPAGHLGKPLLLTTIRAPEVGPHGEELGICTAGVVVTSSSGEPRFEVEKVHEPTDDGMGRLHITLLLAFIDVDNDGTEEAIFRRKKRAEDSDVPMSDIGTGMLRIAKDGKVTEYIFVDDTD